MDILISIKDIELKALYPLYYYRRDAEGLKDNRIISNRDNTNMLIVALNGYNKGTGKGNTIYRLFTHGIKYKLATFFIICNCKFSRLDEYKN